MKQWRFWATNVNVKSGHFGFTGSGFAQNFRQLVYNRKDTKQYTFCSVQAYLKGKDMTSVWSASLKNAGTS